MNQTKKLNVADFPDWQEYYWTYQYHLARDFYVPMFEEWGITGEGLKVVDVGCGDGGFTAALADWGATCTGIEIKPFIRKAYDNPRLKYMVQDITALDAPEIIGDDNGLVILRDVIEHIPVPSKGTFLQSALRLMNPGGRMLITFPPYYSPFGLHQQTTLKSRLRKVPFLSLLPKAALDFIMEKAGETDAAMGEIDYIRESRMTICGFKRLVKAQGLRIVEEKHYLIRPSHEIRYGWRTTGARWGRVPLLRETFILGTAFLLTKET